MRYIGPHVKRGRVKATPAMVDTGKKLLGYLQNMINLGGAPTVQRIVKLADGSIVRAAFFNGQPLVDYYPADTKDMEDTGCRLTMESGMLDLGENTAGLGQAALFADVQPRIYFGDTSKIGGKAISSVLRVLKNGEGYEVLAELLDPSITDRLSDACNPATAGGITATRTNKIHAQGRLQASMWTGLMHNYVQAIYGAPGAVYGPFNFRTIPEYAPLKSARLAIAVPMFSSTVDTPKFYVIQPQGIFTSGLIDPDHSYRYWFTRAFSDRIEFVPAVVVSRCAQLLLSALKSGTVPKTKRKRMEQYLLPSLVPDTDPTKKVVLTFATPVAGSPVAYGWKFNERGSEIAMVVHPGTDNTQLVTRQISYDTHGALQLNEVDGPLVPWYPPFSGSWPGQIFVPDAFNATMLRYDALLTGVWPSGRNVDAPVYCYYIKQTDTSALDFGQATVLEIVNMKMSIGGAVIAPGQDACTPVTGGTDGFACYGPLLANDNVCRSRTLEDSVSVSGGYYTPRASAVRVFTLERNSPWVSSGGRQNRANHHNNFAVTTAVEAFDRGEYGQVGPGPYTTLNATALCAAAPASVDTYVGVVPSDLWFIADTHTSVRDTMLGAGINPGTSALSTPLCDCPHYDGGAPYATLSYRTYTAQCPGAATVHDPDAPGIDYVFTSGKVALGTRATLHSKVLSRLDSYRFTSAKHLEKPTCLIIPCGNASAVAFREYDHRITNATRYSNYFNNSGPAFTYPGGVGSYSPWTVQLWVTIEWNDPQVTANACIYNPEGGLGVAQYRNATISSSDTGTPTNAQQGGSQFFQDPFFIDPASPYNTAKNYSTVRGVQAVRGTWCPQGEIVATTAGAGTVATSIGDSSAAAGEAPICGDVDITTDMGASNTPILNRGLTEAGSYTWTEEYDATSFFMENHDAIRYYSGAAGAAVRFDDFAHLTSQKYSPGTALFWTHAYPPVAFPSFVGWA